MKVTKDSFNSELELLVEIDEDMDDEGLTRFTLYWPDDRDFLGKEGFSAQCFHADLDQHLKKWQERGNTVRYLE